MVWVVRHQHGLYIYIDIYIDIYTVFEIKVLFCAPLGCTHIDTVRPGIILCTPLEYCNENWVKKCAPSGAHVPKTCARPRKCVRRALSAPLISNTDIDIDIYRYIYRFFFFLFFLDISRYIYRYIYI